MYRFSAPRVLRDRFSRYPSNRRHSPVSVVGQPPLRLFRSPHLAQGYAGFRERYRLLLPSPACRNRFTFPISRVRTHTRIRGDRYKCFRMEYPDTIRAEKQPEVLPCPSFHGDSRHDHAVFHYHHSYPSSKSARSGRASSPSRTRL